LYHNVLDVLAYAPTPRRSAPAFLFGIFRSLFSLDRLVVTTLPLPFPGLELTNPDL